MSCFLRNEIKLGSSVTATILLAAGHSNEAYIIGQIVRNLTPNVKPAFFYTKPFLYISVASSLIMINLLHHTV